MTDIDDILRHHDEIIDRVGWAVVQVLPTCEDPEPATVFAYTVGLTALLVPELLIAGLPPEVAHTLLNDLALRVYDTMGRFTHGQRISDLIADYDAIIVEGPATEDLPPGFAIARYGPDRVRLQQVVWPDPAGRFPWQAGYHIDPKVQPLIGHP